MTDRLRYAAAALSTAAFASAMAALILTVTGCTGKPVDHGRCLEEREIGPWVQMQPTMMGGKTLTMIPIVHPAYTKCDRWEFPEGRA